MTQNRQPTAAFGGLQDQINALRKRAPGVVRAGHLNIGETIWLSCDPQGQAEMSCIPEEQRFRLGLKAADSGRWACLGLRLPVEVLAQGRYLGLLIDAAPNVPVSFTPCLRYYFREGGMQDVGTAEPILLSTRRHNHMAYVPIDPALLNRSHGAELNLFFHTDEAMISFTRLEPLLMS